MIDGKIVLIDALTMNCLSYLPIELRKTIEHKCLLKVISGLNNFNLSSIEKVAWSAGKGGADLLDVACAPDIVRLANRVSGLPICVSTIDPYDFKGALDAGATLLEIGNFDSFYAKGRFFDAKEVLDLALTTKQLYPNVPLSVTVPHTLPLNEQAQLALDLVDAGVDFIQTEGGTSAQPINAGSLGLIEKAAPTLAATYEIKKALMNIRASTPIICASGLSSVSLPLAIAAGASGVGVGSAVSLAEDELAMLAVVRRLRTAIPLHRSCLNKI